MNILFVCSRNQWRSPTGEQIYKNAQGINAKSAGTEPSARTKINAKLIDWADIIFVMEKKFKKPLQIFFTAVQVKKKTRYKLTEKQLGLKEMPTLLPISDMTA